MKSYFKLTILLLLAAGFTILISPLLASVFPYHLYRVMSRVIIIVVFILFYRYREQLGIVDIKSLGFRAAKKWWLLLAAGLLLALFSVLVIFLLMVITAVRFIVPNLASWHWLGNSLGYLVTGFFVALIEETLFRGFIFQSLLRDTPVSVALLITNIFYALVHFLRPNTYPLIEIMNLGGSLQGLYFFFIPLMTNWHNIWPDFLGLFLIGLVLSFAYLRTRSLALSIGLHAGWVIGMKFLSLTTDVTREGSIWINGKLLQYPLTWCLMVSFILIFNLPRFRRQE